ncbi:MAG: Peptidase propeptide and domain [Myxococcaceae bacterium]|nr:Peptidase propeptide and domain [Myxococcaceae bacterium]
MKPIYRSIGLALLLGVTSTAGAATVASAAETHQAKIAIADARAKALSLVSGTLIKEELENEHGRWIYSFEIKPTGEKGKSIKEVNIDADTGAVISIDTETD